MSASLILWYLAFQLFAFAALPHCARVFRTLPDRGYALSKIAGWLSVSYLVWVTGMLGLTRFTGASVLVIALAAGASCWWRWRADVTAAWSQRRDWLTVEVIFTGTLVLAALVRAYTPDIAGQEKFMDYAIMNSFLIQPHLPAPDPWLAGYGMPYYHFAYFTHALLAKVSGAPGPSAYNLSMALVFALTAVGAFSLVSNLVRLSGGTSRLGADLAGGLAAVLTMVAGNLEAVLELLAQRGLGSPEFWTVVGVKNLRPAAAPQGWLPTDGGWWWRASRVVPTTQPDGINEFPYFSFILGDLHPHYMALPLDLLVVALAVTALIRPVTRLVSPRAAVSALALGLVIPAHTWDVPVFWGLFGAFSLMGIWLGDAGWRALRPLAVTYLAAVVLVLPYFVGYTSQPLSLALVDERTPLPSLLIIFGTFIVVATTWLLIGPSASGSTLSRQRWLTATLVVSMITAAVAALGGARSLAMALLLAGLAVHRALTVVLADEQPRAGHLAELVAAGLLTAGFAIVAGTELVFIKDSFGTRMNTIFKLHYNAWLLLGLGAALAIATLAARRGARRAIGLALGAVAVAAGAVYPVAATYTKAGELAGAPTLDGTVGLRRTYPNDFGAIDWLRSAVTERAAVVEAVGDDYRDFARVSTFSGMPTPIGWIGHELQWRGQMDEFGQRERLVRAVYTAQDSEALRAALTGLDARYVFIGRLERERYGQDVGERLRTWLPLAQQRGDAMLLSVPPAGAR